MLPLQYVLADKLLLLYPGFAFPVADPFEFKRLGCSTSLRFYGPQTESMQKQLSQRELAIKVRVVLESD